MSPQEIAGAAIDEYVLLRATWECDHELAKILAVDKTATEAAVRDWLRG